MRGFWGCAEFGSCSSLDLLEHYKDRLSVRARAYLGLLHLRMLREKPSQGGSMALVLHLTQSIMYLIRVQGRNAYVVAHPGGGASAGTEENSLVLALFSEVGQNWFGASRALGSLCSSFLPLGIATAAGFCAQQSC